MQESDLGKVVWKISKEISSEKLKIKAKDLIDCWFRMIYGLNSNYDANGNYEDQYWKFKRQKLWEVEDVASP